MRKLILLCFLTASLASAQSSARYNKLDGYVTNGVHSAAMYGFAPKTPGGSLTSAIGNTVTFTAAMGGCPFGVAGADSGHYLRVSGGVGTAEDVLITGGTCTSGAPSGTVIFTPANTHSGAWTITSSTGGLYEAAKAAVGRKLVVSSATTLTAPSLTIPATVELEVTSGAVITTAVTAITIVGPYHFPNAQVFALSGTAKVRFTGNRSLTTWRPEWWGAKADGSTDSTAALQAMLDAAGVVTGSTGMAPHMMLTPGIYSTTSQLNYKGSSGIGFLMDCDGSSTRAATNGCQIIYNGAENVSTAVFYLNGPNAVEIGSIAFNANRLAGIGLWIDSTVDTGGPNASFNRLYRVVVINPKGATSAGIRISHYPVVTTPQNDQLEIIEPQIAGYEGETQAGITNCKSVSGNECTGGNTKNIRVSGGTVSGCSYGIALITMTAVTIQHVAFSGISTAAMKLNGDYGWVVSNAQEDATVGTATRFLDNGNDSGWKHLTVADNYAVIRVNADGYIVKVDGAVTFSGNDFHSYDTGDDQRTKIQVMGTLRQNATSGSMSAIESFGNLYYNTAWIIDTAANSGCVRATNVVTCKTTAVNAIVNGETVHVFGLTDDSFNGSFIVTSVPTTSSFTYAQPGPDATTGSTSAGGAVEVNVFYDSSGNSTIAKDGVFVGNFAVNVREMGDRSATGGNNIAMPRLARDWSGATIRPRKIITPVVTVPYAAGAGAASTYALFDLALGNVFKLTLTGNAANVRIAGGYPGQQITTIICQDGSGAHTFAWKTPAALPGDQLVSGFTAVDATASKCTVQSFVVITAGTSGPIMATSAGAVN